MAVHPVTPMDEADLGRHLASQTSLRVGLIDFVAMKRGRADEVLAQEIGRDAAIVSIDVLDAETLREAGRLIWERGSARQFVVGSQGVEQALVAYWRAAGLLPCDVDRSRLCARWTASRPCRARCRRSRRADPPSHRAMASN